LKESFLFAACLAGQTEEVQSLLSMDADVNWHHSHDGNSTCLIAACKNNHSKVGSLVRECEVLEIIFLVMLKSRLSKFFFNTTRLMSTERTTWAARLFTLRAKTAT
jgi:hypothetical protein